MSELIADGLGVTSAIACLVAVGGCALLAASAGDDRFHVFRQPIRLRWAYRFLGLLMLIALDSVIRRM